MTSIVNIFFSFYTSVLYFEVSILLENLLYSFVYGLDLDTFFLYNL